ncbi:MAG: histone deacetylase superfamily [Candidatus Sulfotelmatobacter sp.]|nr:histone deacetylase superfamily [Candidatus Sulfotelmatobacter sp.]
MNRGLPLRLTEIGGLGVERVASTKARAMLSRIAKSRAPQYHKSRTVMLPFKLVYSDAYYLPIGQHVFPAEKYRRIHDRLISNKIAEAHDFLKPQPASDEDILLVHTPEYVHKLKTGTLSPREEMELEIPYSRNLVEAFWLSAGGSILAARQALTDGVSVNIGGGFHHAFPDHGEGFCMIHDVAVAIRRMQRDENIRTAMTVDCDVHHGNGTAAIFPGTRTTTEPLPSAGPGTLGPSSRNSRASGKIRVAHSGDVFTISLHQHNNYPLWKPPSSIDVDLPDGTTDDDYLAWLDNALSSGLRQFEPDLLCYIAGADPYREDQLGGLSLTIDGLKRRDELVFRVARARNIPVMVTYAGGYARNVEDTVTIHCDTVIAAKEVFTKRMSS